MKKIKPIISVISLMLFLASFGSAFSQSVGIGSSAFGPDVSSMLEIKSTNSGLLIPRLTLAQRATIVLTASPTGLLIYQTDNTPGFYYWDGSSWKMIGSGGAAGSGWNLTGNTGTTAGIGNSYIGTNDNMGLAFVTNTAECMRLQTTGDLTIGATADGNSKLDVHQGSANDVARFTTYGNNNYLRLRRANGTVAGPTVVSVSGTMLGKIIAEGYNGTSYTPSSSIKFETDNTSSTTVADMPGRICFSTAIDNTGPLTERLRINSKGIVIIGDSSYNSGLKKLYVSNVGSVGTSYQLGTSACAISGLGGGAAWSFGVIGYNQAPFTFLRSGGVLGSTDLAGTWGALAYFSSGSANCGAYFTAAASTGVGFMANSNLQGFGSCSFGDLMGSWSRGELFGSTSMGALYASYNLGNEYTSGVSADIVTNNNERNPAYSVTSNDVKVYGNGKAKLINGVCKVTFDKSFQNLISMQENPTVTVSALGECEGLFIVSFDKDGFTVKEFRGGQSNVEFTWIAIAKRVDADKVSNLPDAIKDKDFDTNMKDVMFNENIKNKSGKPIWWDGSKLRFDKPPVQNSEIKSKKF